MDFRQVSYPAVVNPLTPSHKVSIVMSTKTSWSYKDQAFRRSDRLGSGSKYDVSGGRERSEMWTSALKVSTTHLDSFSILSCKIGKQKALEFEGVTQPSNAHEGAGLTDFFLHYYEL